MGHLGSYADFTFNCDNSSVSTHSQAAASVFCKYDTNTG